VDYDEYEALVGRIFEKKPAKPIVILVEMPAVEKVLKKVVILSNLYCYYLVLISFLF
jgi:ribosomal protein S17